MFILTNIILVHNGSWNYAGYSAKESILSLGLEANFLPPRYPSYKQLF